MTRSDEPVPPYRRVADQLRTLIRDDRAVGDQLPTYTALAGQFDVSVGTAKSAVALLRQEGLIATVHGKGSFVRAKPDEGTGADSPDTVAEIRARLDELTDRVEAVERQVRGS